MSTISSRHVISLPTTPHVLATTAVSLGGLGIDPCVWNRALFKHKVALSQSLYALLGAQSINIFTAQET